MPTANHVLDHARWAPIPAPPRSSTLRIASVNVERLVPTLGTLLRGSTPKCIPYH